MIRKILAVLLMAVLLPIIAIYVSAAAATADQADTAVYKKATFAGGCFWCMEHPFEKLDGVKGVISGYAGGQEKNPTYAEVSSGATGHVESVQITYDPAKVSYSELLDLFWRQIDPTDSGGQFVDRGFQYSTAIFYHTDSQRLEAEASKAALDTSGRYSSPIVTRIVEADKFYPAEEYHQDYYKKSAFKYRFYRYRSGRDQFLEKIWGNEDENTGDKETGKISIGSGGTERAAFNEKEYVKPSKEELKSSLTPLQYVVTQEDGTERAYENTYWDNKRDGIYVDVVSGEPLFSSTDKYVSGTGWPSFTKPIKKSSIVTKEDRRLFGVRTELRSKYGDSHLGHLFNDGPAPAGLRYCINSAALRFVPMAELETEGLGEYSKLFESRVE